MKKTGAFKGSTSELAALADGALARFFQANKRTIKILAQDDRAELTRAVDWLEAAGHVPPTPALDQSASSDLRSALIIEPEPRQAQKIYDVLTNMGIPHIEIAHDYSSAIESALFFVPNIIFSETELEDGKSGIEAINAIASHFPTKSLL